MKRLAALTLLLGVLGAGPAWAHEEINPSRFPVGQPTFLTLTAANEKQVKLTKLTVTAPGGLAFGSATRDPAGWTSSRTDTTVTWTGGSVDPARFESFGFEIEGADQPGTLSYKATLGYADASADDVTVQVTATAADESASSASAGSGSGRANLALGLGACALVAALAALVLSGRGGHGAAAASDTPGPGSGGGAGAGQDW
jgi:uncharacterized protein YcnI